MARDAAVSTTYQGLIVAGMHRSATSLVTSVLRQRGWQTRGSFVASGKGNPRGLYEDRAVHDLHRSALTSYRAYWDHVTRLRELRGAPMQLRVDRAELEKTVARLRSHSPWLWKNPRASLFLADWARVLPEAQFLICVRDPAAVVDSMLRRENALGVAETARLLRQRRIVAGLSLWHTYNLHADRFAGAHPERAVIFRVPDDLPVLQDGAGATAYEPDLLGRRPPADVQALSWAAIHTQLLYRRLRARHDPGRLARIFAGPRPG